LLNELDGLSSKSGILVIGTTNHPEQIDSALVHRPSRFDRVWHFPLPDLKMRLNYLKGAFPDINQSVVQIIAEETDDWSFAYLNELRTTAAILCMGRQNDCLHEQDVENAHDLLAAQFEAGRKNHIISEGLPSLGFKAA
jgi:SpoVK/Ycf46/Vps4 family AAA+-type ATPase